MPDLPAEIVMPPIASQGAAPTSVLTVSPVSTLGVQTAALHLDASLDYCHVATLRELQLRCARCRTAERG